jgi:serine/threonine protein kinase
MDSSLDPILYRVEGNPTLPNHMKILPYIGSSEDKIVFKVVSLSNRSEDQLDEIRNEIRIAFLLQESLLSIHFALVLDYFTIDGNLLKRGRLHQVIAVESLDQTLKDYFSEMKKPSLAKLRPILFQIAHTLEIAWDKYKFIHYDLHFKNIMVKLLKEGECLYQKNFHYHRKNQWYKLSHQDRDDSLVKIIDFGRSRIEVSGEVIGPWDFPLCGYSPSLPPNPYYDCRMLFYELASLKPCFWDRVRDNSGTGELTLFNDMANKVLDMDRMSGLYLNTNKKIFTFSDYVSNQGMRDWSAERTNYIRSVEEFGLLPTQVLDHPFFAPLVREVGENPGKDDEIITNTFI